MASRLRAVSSSVSPLTVDDDEPEMLTASADSRLAAISNEVRVRVDGSRKRLMTVLPAQRRHLLDGPLGDLQEPLAEVEQHASSSAAVSVSMPSRWRWAKPAHARRSRRTTRSTSPRSASITRTDSRGGGLDRDAHEVGLDGQLAPPAVDQRRQLDRARAAVVGQHVHRRADGAPGVRARRRPGRRSARRSARAARSGRSRAWAARGRRRRGRARCRPRPAAAAASPASDHQAREALRQVGAAGAHADQVDRPRRPAGPARRSPAPCAAACARCRRRRGSRAARSRSLSGGGRRGVMSSRSFVTSNTARQRRERVPDAAGADHADRPEVRGRARARSCSARAGQEPDRQGRHADEPEVQLALERGAQVDEQRAGRVAARGAKPDHRQLGAGADRQVAPVGRAATSTPTIGPTPR